jgi:hypothetical protein
MALYNKLRESPSCGKSHDHLPKQSPLANRPPRQPLHRCRLPWSDPPATLHADREFELTLGIAAERSVRSATLAAAQVGQARAVTAPPASGGVWIEDAPATSPTGSAAEPRRLPLECSIKQQASCRRVATPTDRQPSKRAVGLEPERSDLCDAIEAKNLVLPELSGVEGLVGSELFDRPPARFWPRREERMGAHVRIPCLV